MYNAVRFAVIVTSIGHWVKLSFKNAFNQLILTIYLKRSSTALFTFSDGRYIGAILDRNGLRPSRYYVTKQGYMVMASEVGVSTFPDEEIVQKVNSNWKLLNLIQTGFPLYCLVCLSGRTKIRFSRGQFEIFPVAILLECSLLLK